MRAPHMKKLSIRPRWRFESQLLWWVDPGVASTHLAVIREAGNGSERTFVTLPTQWPRNRRQNPDLFLSAEIKWVSLAATVTHVDHAAHNRGRGFWWRNRSAFYVICGSSALQLRCSRWPNVLLRLTGVWPLLQLPPGRQDIPLCFIFSWFR